MRRRTGDFFVLRGFFFARAGRLGGVSGNFQTLSEALALPAKRIDKV